MSKVPSCEQIAAEIRRERKFGLILDMPPEDNHAGRHVFIHPERAGLLADAISWFNEAPGPSTAGLIKSLTANNHSSETRPNCVPADVPVSLSKRTN